MKPPRKPSSWFNLWAQERQLLGPSTPRPVPGLDPRLVSEDPLLRQQATREAGQARGREVQEQLRQGGRGEEVASELLLRALNPAYDVAKTLPEAQAMWQAGGFGNRARAVRDMALAALPVVPSLAGTLRRVKGASEAAEGGKTLQSRLWEHLTTQDGFTVNRRGDPMQGNGFLVADPEHTLVIRTDKGAPPPEVQIARWMRRPAVRAALRRKGAHFGGWHDKETGRFEINITDVVTDRDEAMLLAERRRQKAVGEMRGGEYIEHRTKPPRGSDLAESIAARFRQDVGRADDPGLPAIESVDPEAGRRMARVYERLKSNPDDPEVRAAYAQFMEEVDAQYKALEDAGITINFVDEDPYSSSAAMMDDVAQNRQLDVLRTNRESAHPLLTPEQNDRFRAVHDFFGHTPEGNQFGPKGEEMAFRAHMRMFSPLARRVLATETRGQNSWFNFGPHSARAPKDRPFAQQKAALWPEELLGDYDAVRAYDDRAARYDPYVKPATNTEDYTIPEPVTTQPITRVENAEGVGPYSGGKTTDQWMAEASELQGGDRNEIALARGRRWPLPETQPPPGWRFGFKSPSAMRRWFNEPELTALQHAGFNPREYELLPNPESGLLRKIAGRGGQVAFDPERAYPAILGGTDADLYRLEQRRLSEGFAEQDRWADYVARREAGGAEAAAARDTERRLAEFERTRLTPAIDVPEVGQFPGRSHFDATVKFEAAAPPERFPSQRAIDRALRRAREGFASQRRGFLDRRAAMAELTKAQQKIAAPINAELGFNPMELTSEALGEVQRPPEPVAPLAGDEVRATIARMEALLGQPGERFVPRSRGIFDRSVRDPVIEGSSLPAVRGRPNPLVEEIAADPETYRLARMAIERGLPMGGAGFYEFGPIRAAFEEAGGPISFDDFVWSGSASSAMQPVPSELSNASILLYAMRHGISVEEAVAEMLARYPKAKRPYMLPVHRSGFEQYLRTGRIDPESPTSGARKIPSYGRGKLGEADVNVLDTHEMSFLGMPSRWRRYLEGKKLTGADYEALDLNRRIARDLGIETRQAQAGRWIGGADVTGVRTPPGDYIQILEDAIYNQAQLLGRGTTPAALRRQFRDIFTEGNDFLLPIYSRRTP